MAPLWYDLVKRLQTRSEAESKADSLVDRADVLSLLDQAKDAASKDSDWSSSGLPESLQRARDLCEKQSPAAAVAAAIRLLDFQHIVEAKSSSSPKAASPKQGASVNSIAELQIPQLQSHLPDADSRTSLPVITIRNSSDPQSVPTTTTIVLQAAPVSTPMPQQILPERASSPPASDAHDHKLSVLKSKNGRSNALPPAGKDSKPRQHVVFKSFDAFATIAKQQLLPQSASQHRAPVQTPSSLGGVAQQHPTPSRARSPPSAAQSQVLASQASQGRSDQEAKVARCQPSPFEAPEAQLQEARGSNSDKSNSDNSDKSLGNVRRTRSRDEDAESSDGSNGSRHKRSRMERVVSIGTVLRCVDTHADRDGSFDDAVGELPATVHEMTEGAAAAALQARRHSTECTSDAQQLLQNLYGQQPPGASGDAKLESRSSDEERTSPTQPAQVSLVNGAARAQPKEEPGSVSIVLSPASAEPTHARTNASIGPSQGSPSAAANIIGPSVITQLRPLAFPALPLSGPPPLVQIPMHIPPLKVDLIAGPKPDSKPDSKQAPLQAKAVQLSSVPRAEPVPGSLATTLWSGKVKHKLGQSTVDLFYMTALIPEQYLEQFPPTLYVTSLATQKEVKLGRHFVMRCRLDFVSEKQLGKLQILAQGKVVAICRLQHCTVTLVPYWDMTRALRAVGFMLAHE